MTDDRIPANLKTERAGYPFCGEGAYRRSTCDTCKRYLKTIDLREPVCEAGLAAAGAGYR